MRALEYVEKDGTLNVIALAEWGTVSSSDGSERVASRTSVSKEKQNWILIDFLARVYILNCHRGRGNEIDS